MRRKKCNEICWGWGASQFQRLAPPQKKSLQKKSCDPALGIRGSIFQTYFVMFFVDFRSNATDMFRWRYFRTVQRGMRSRRRTISKCQVQNIGPCANTYRAQKTRGANCTTVYWVWRRKQTETYCSQQKKIIRNATLSWSERGRNWASKMFIVTSGVGIFEI